MYTPPTNIYNSPTGGWQETPREDGFAGITEGQGGTDWGGIMNQGMNALQVGADAYGQGVANTNEFSIDPWAGYTGSLKGLASGGVIGAIAGGIGGQLGTFKAVNENLKNLNTDVNLSQTDAYGNPIYNSQAYINSKDTVSALNKGEKAITRSLDPGTRLFSGLFGTRHKIRRERAKLKKAAAKSQQEFNTSYESAGELDTARQGYMRRRNMTNRLLNLYQY